MSKKKSPAKVYVIHVGNLDDENGRVRVRGAFQTLGDALKARNKLYWKSSWLEMDDLDEDERKETEKKLESMSVDNGQEFFDIVRVSPR